MLPAAIALDPTLNFRRKRAIHLRRLLVAALAAAPADPVAVAKVLTTQLDAIDKSDLAPADKARLLATLGDALLRAYSVAEIEKELAALVKDVQDLKAAKGKTR